MSEEKLSVRLDIVAKIHTEIGGQSAMAAVIREAAQLARRVEEAPAHFVSSMPGTYSGFGVIAVHGDLVNQRVRLVREA